MKIMIIKLEHNSQVGVWRGVGSIDSDCYPFSMYRRDEGGGVGGWLWEDCKLVPLMRDL